MQAKTVLSDPIVFNRFGVHFDVHFGVRLIYAALLWNGRDSTLETLASDKADTI
jgi:hypothetical protein